MIHLSKEDFILLKSILQKYPYSFYAYGSRVKGTYQKFSDLDLCIMENISNKELWNLKEELEESNLSIKIDLKRWDKDMASDFKSLIKHDLILLQAASSPKI